jgi:Mg2+ and Co2+ transporter CorA
MKILSIFTLVLLVSTLICGLWMKFGQGEKDVGFHMMLSLSTVIFSIITISLYLLKSR